MYSLLSSSSRYLLTTVSSFLLSFLLSDLSLPYKSEPVLTLFLPSSHSVSHDQNQIKTGIPKDERNTSMTQVRYRDGKILRREIGLTSGMG